MDKGPDPEWRVLLSPTWLGVFLFQVCGKISGNLRTVECDLEMKAFKRERLDQLTDIVKAAKAGNKDAFNAIVHRF
jgi:hypothetical protein